MGRQAASLALRGRASQLARQRRLLIAVLAACWFGIAAALPSAAASYLAWSAAVELGPTVGLTTRTASTGGGERNERPLKVVRTMSGDLNPFVNPDGVAVDRHGNLYVADSGNNRIQELDSHGRLI